MSLAIEVLILCITLGIFVIQHRLKHRVSIVSSKLIYWTTLLFASFGVNSVLYALYPTSYDLMAYANRDTAVVILGVIIGYIILQLIAPSRAIQRLIKKLNKKKEEVGEVVSQEKEEHNSYLKELHFETFLETICWLAFVFALALQAVDYIFGVMSMDFGIATSMKDIVCLMMIGTVPIGIRQIVFYLYRIRGIKEEQEMTEIEMKFHQKLRNNNHKL